MSLGIKIWSVAILLAMAVGIQNTFADCSIDLGAGGDSGSGFGLTAQDVAAEFTAGCTGTISSLTARIKNTGSPSGNAILEIQTNAAGLPSNTAITNGTSNGNTATGSYSDVTFTFATPPTVTSGTTYHIVGKVDGGRNDSNHYEWDVVGSGAGRAYTSGSLSNWNNLNNASHDVYGTITTSPPPPPPPPTATTTTASTTQVQSGDIQYMLMWMIFYATLMFLGFIFSIFGKRKIWN